MSDDLADNAPVAPEVPLTEAQRNELDRRLADLKAHPEDGSTWDVVKSRILLEQNQ